MCARACTHAHARTHGYALPDARARTRARTQVLQPIDELGAKKFLHQVIADGFFDEHTALVSVTFLMYSNARSRSFPLSPLARSRPFPLRYNPTEHLVTWVDYRIQVGAAGRPTALAHSHR